MLPRSIIFTIRGEYIEHFGILECGCLVRYAPRHISRVFVRRPNGSFVEARYRHLAYPPVSLWERNAGVRRLREKERHEVESEP